MVNLECEHKDNSGYRLTMMCSRIGAPRHGRWYGAKGGVAWSSARWCAKTSNSSTCDQSETAISVIHIFSRAAVPQLSRQLNKACTYGTEVSTTHPSLGGVNHLWRRLGAVQVVDALDPLVDLSRVLLRVLDRPCVPRMDESVGKFVVS